MSDMGQVHIKDTGVWLYSHNGADRMVSAVSEALAKKRRWEDPEYLTRIIFDQLTQGHHGETESFGIGTEEHRHTRRIIEIDCNSQQAKVLDLCECGFWHVSMEKSFRDFASEATGRC